MYLKELRWVCVCVWMIGHCLPPTSLPIRFLFAYTCMCCPPTASSHPSFSSDTRRGPHEHHPPVSHGWLCLYGHRAFSEERKSTLYKSFLLFIEKYEQHWCYFWLEYTLLHLSLENRQRWEKIRNLKVLSQEMNGEVLLLLCPKLDKIHFKNVS